MGEIAKRWACAAAGALAMAAVFGLNDGTQQGTDRGALTLPPGWTLDPPPKPLPAVDFAAINGRTATAAAALESSTRAERQAAEQAHQQTRQHNEASFQERAQE